MKILFLASSLDFGGAQRQLIVLANELGRRGHAVAIAVYYSGGQLEKEIDSSCVRLVRLGKRSRWHLFSFLWRLLHVIRRERPDVLHGWMSTPNLIVSLVRFLYPKVQVFWGIRCADLELFVTLTRIERLANWFERRLSRFADAIVVNSRSGLKHFLSRGFPRKKIIHIPNGIDVGNLYPDPTAGEKARAEWGISQSQKLVGLIGRLHPIKRHALFLEAAARLALELPEVRFICIGAGPEHYRETLQSLSRELGLGQKVLWVPPRSDVRVLYNALDVVCLCSSSEGFPNVIAEAMACGRQCVVTNVGDCSVLVGNAGIVVRSGDSEALAQGVRQALNTVSSNQAARQRILDHFTIAQLAERTERVFRSALASRAIANSWQPDAWAPEVGWSSDAANCGKGYS